MPCDATASQGILNGFTPIYQSVITFCNMS